MKKLSILILLTIITLTSCDQIASFFATLTANRTEGTTEDEFTFTVDTNDTVIGWYVDGQSINRSERSISSESFIFEPGNHTITVETENVDPVSVSVYVYEPVVDPPADTEPVPLKFTIELFERAEISPVSYNSPILKYDITELNLLTMSTNLPYTTITATDFSDYRLIYLKMGVPAWLLEHMANYPNTEISEADFIVYLNEVKTAVEPVPVIAETVFSILAATSNIPDTFSVSDTEVTISGVSTDFSDLPSTISGTTQTLHISFKVDSSDATIFYGDNLQNFFGMDYPCLALDELKTVAEILRRFPEESIVDLAGELGK